MKKRIGYMCGVDFQHEFDHPTSIGLYTDVNSLKSASPCWEECGIVKVEITVAEWVEPQTFGKKKT